VLITISLSSSNMAVGLSHPTEWLVDFGTFHDRDNTFILRIPDTGRDLHEGGRVRKLELTTVIPQGKGC
jgi:hypothetical protein